MRIFASVHFLLSLIGAAEPAAGKLRSVGVLKGHGFQRLRKNSILHLILGGAALQRCGKGIILNPALAAEVAVYCPGMSFFATSSSRAVSRLEAIPARLEATPFQNQNAGFQFFGSL